VVFRWISVDRNSKYILFFLFPLSKLNTQHVSPDIISHRGFLPLLFLQTNTIGLLANSFVLCWYIYQLSVSKPDKNVSVNMRWSQRNCVFSTLWGPAENRISSFDILTFNQKRTKINNTDNKIMLLYYCCVCKYVKLLFFLLSQLVHYSAAIFRLGWHNNKSPQAVVISRKPNCRKNGRAPSLSVSTSSWITFRFSGSPLPAARAYIMLDWNHTHNELFPPPMCLQGTGWYVIMLREPKNVMKSV